MLLVWETSYTLMRSPTWGRIPYAEPWGDCTFEHERFFLLQGQMLSRLTKDVWEKRLVGKLSTLLLRICKWFPSIMHIG